MTKRPARFACDPVRLRWCSSLCPSPLKCLRYQSSTTLPRCRRGRRLECRRLIILLPWKYNRSALSPPTGFAADRQACRPHQDLTSRGGHLLGLEYADSQRKNPL